MYFKLILTGRKMRGNGWGHDSKSSLTPPLFFFSKQLSLTLVLEDLKDKSDCLHCLTFSRIKPGLLALKEGCLIFLNHYSFCPVLARAAKQLIRQFSHSPTQVGFFTVPVSRKPAKTVFSWV